MSTNPANPFFYDPPSENIKGGIIVDIMQIIVIALAIFVFMYIFLAIPNQVEGQSMEPNFHDRELLLTNKLIQLVGNSSIGDKLNYDYKRGDVVIFQLPGNPDFIKRIIAGPGDRIKIENNHPVVNGKVIYEAYIPSTTQTQGNSFLEEGVEIQIAEDSNKYFVMGDNREASKDSRSKDVGLVDRKYFKGKVFLRWWPIGDFGLIGRGEYEEIDENKNSNEKNSSTKKIQILSNLI